MINLTKIIFFLPIIIFAQTRQNITYTYDNLNRIKKVTNADGSSIEYTYDKLGNRESKIYKAPSVDYVATGITVNAEPSGELFLNHSYDISIQISNEGTLETEETVTGILYFSDSDILDTDTASILETYTITPIPVSEERELAYTHTIPNDLDGVLYYHFFIDTGNIIDEGDEANNRIRSEAYTIKKSIFDIQFEVASSDATCIDRDNGSVSISTNDTEYAYEIEMVNNKGEAFTGVLNTSNDWNYILENLQVGKYDIFITLADFGSSDFSQHISFEIGEPEPLLASFVAGKTLNTYQVNLLGGTAPFEVLVNGVVQITTQQTNMEVFASEGDTVVIRSSKPCEGIVQKELNGELKVFQIYPNPTDSTVNVMLPNTSERRESLSVLIFNPNGIKIFEQNVSIQGNLLTLDLSRYSSGMYFIHIPMLGQTFNILKK